MNKDVTDDGALGLADAVAQYRKDHTDTATATNAPPADAITLDDLKQVIDKMPKIIKELDDISYDLFKKVSSRMWGW